MAASTRARTAIDIILIFVCLVLPHLGIFPAFTYVIVILPLLWGYLKLHGENFSSIGFRFRDLSLNSFLIGGSIGTAYAFFSLWIMTPLLSLLGFAPPELSDFDFVRGNILSLLLLIMIAAFLVIPYEEIIFRGFIFTRLRVMFAANKRPYWTSGLLLSMLFAAYHYQEGYGAVLSIFIGAVFVVWLYKIFNRNLWYLIFFHILYDVVMLAAIHLNYL